MIKQLHVENFRSIADVTVDFSPVTVLVGKSGTGKTNFVDSIRFLRNFVTTKRMDQDRGFQSATNPGSPLVFDVVFDVKDREYRYRLAMNIQPSVTIKEEILEVAGKPVFHQQLVNKTPTWTIKPDVASVPRPGLPAIDQLPTISDAVIAYALLTTGIGCYEFPGGVLSNLAGRTAPHAAGLDDHALNYIDVVKDISTDLHDLDARVSITQILKHINPTLSSVELDNINTPKKVVVGHAFESKPLLELDLSQESEGFRRFYAHLLAIYQKPAKQMLIFEHPEDGIHPGALSLLAEEFKATPACGRGQVLLTTHSPKLLDSFDADHIRVVEIENLKTKIGVLDKAQQVSLRDNLMEPGELLTVDDARIDSEEK